jgi:hypothetical protein
MSRDEQWRAARNEARRTVLSLARDAGATLIRRPLFHDADTTVQDVEPLAGLRAARQVELGARHAARDYARQAREAGHSWRDIGRALGLVPGGDAQQAGETVAEAAYAYAAGHPGTETARRYGRSVSWTCGTCGKAIADRGPELGPADGEAGHADGCRQLAASVAAWDAQWTRGEAEWEAGQ